MSEIEKIEPQTNTEPTISAAEYVPDAKKKILLELIDAVYKHDPSQLKDLFSGSDPEKEILNKYYAAQNAGADYEIEYDDETQEKIFNDAVFQELLAIRPSGNADKDREVKQNLRLRAFEIFYDEFRKSSSEVKDISGLASAS